MTNERLIADYATWLRSWGASPKTVEARTVVARSRLKEWGIPGFTVENVQTWLARPDLSRWSRSTYHAHMKDLCAWLVATGHLSDNPMQDVRTPKRPSSLPRPLSEPEVARVLSVATGNRRTWIMLALLAGLRAHEIAKIRGEDVTADGIYVEGKGGVRATIPTHEDLWAIAQDYPRTGHWFPGRGDRPHINAQSVSLGVGDLFRTLGITGSIHRCRHVYGTRLLRAGVNIRTVQQLMRHADLSTTATYTAVDEDELRAAIGRLSA